MRQAQPSQELKPPVCSLTRGTPSKVTLWYTKRHQVLAAAHVLSCYEYRETGKGNFQPVYMHVNEQVTQKEPGYAGNRRSHYITCAAVTRFLDLLIWLILKNKKAPQCSGIICHFTV